MWQKFQLSLGTYQLRYFFLILLLFAVTEGMLIFYVPLQVEAQLGGLLSVGIILAIGNISGILTDLVFGFVSEITDHRKFMHIAAFLSVLILPLLLIQGSWLSFILLAAVWGARFELMFSFASNIYLAKHAPHGRFFEVSGVAFLVRNLGYFLGPLLANLVRFHSTGLVVVSLLVILLVEGVVMYLVFNNHPGEHFTQKSHKLSLYSEYVILKKHFTEVFPHFILSFGVAAFEAMFLIFGPPTFAAINPGLSGLLTAVGLLANVLMPSLVVRFVEFVGPRIALICAAFGVMAGALTVWATLNTVVLLLAIYFCFLCMVVIFVVNDASFLHTLSRLKTSEEDEVISVRSMGPNFAYVIVSLLGGVLVQRAGFQAGVLASAMILIASLMLFKLTKSNDHIRVAPKMYR